MADPATAFALLPELVRLLAEQVRGRKQLAMLRLTNWTFAAAITPILFYDLQVGRGNARRLYDRENCELFRYVRKLTISPERVYFDIHKPVRWLLPKLPNLESFA
ncbi:hypothetical protein SPI_07903 [Niveomyces insectorum RCEF 264]|uniref:Uncharacterized protein n=1 Tax=Niveomyces insectorum RCEF 264 TaxID=1081102 RepID=A0A167P4X4_9HYPO|nr:hypothetical protein SPI_07903 [Niveomyces insectorum RCEF 264]